MIRPALLALLLSQDVGPVPGARLLDEGTSQGQVTRLDCVGAGVVCTRSGTTGTLTIAGGGGYATIQDDGTPQTQRTTVNFAGAGVTCTDSGGITVCTIPGGSGNVGSANVTFGTGGRADWESATTTVAAAWVGASSNILLSPACARTVAPSTVEECFVGSLNCVVTAIIAATSFDVRCYALNGAYGTFIVSYSGS